MRSGRGSRREKIHDSHPNKPQRNGWAGSIIYKNKIHSVIQKIDLASYLFIVYESPLALNSESLDITKTILKGFITPVS